MHRLAVDPRRTWRLQPHVLLARCTAPWGRNCLPSTPTSPAPHRSRIQVPPDLKEALRSNLRALETFEGLSPSCRRDYVEWITEAKREGTRQRRLATTIEWLTAGKSRHWKYEKC